MLCDSAVLQAADFANLLWALAMSDHLRSEAVAQLLASAGELPPDSFSAASLLQLTQVCIVALCWKQAHI